MKTLMFVLVILILAQLPTFAQSFRDDELSVEFVTLVRNVDVRVAPNLATVKDNASFGGRIGYTHWLGRKGGRGDVGIGFETGVTFHSVGESKMALIREQFAFKWQANGNKNFQPSLKLTGGLACDHWTKKGSNSPTNTGCPAFTYGGGVGFDKPLSEGSRKKWRVGFEYFTTNFRNPLNGFRRELQHNFEISTGLVF